MDINNGHFSLCEATVSSAVSQQFSNDYVVPDYEAEVMRVIACRSYPYVTGQNIAGDRLTVDVGVVHRVIYQSYDMTVHTTVAEENYVKTIELKPGEEYYCAEVGVTEEYTGCKALSKRRLDIKGSLNIGYTVYAKRDYETPGETEMNEIKYENISADILTYAETKTVTFLEMTEISIPEENKVECLCDVQIEDYRIVSGKLITKGELKYNIVYFDDELNMENREFSLPFGQIFDVDGINDDDKCDISAICKNIQFSPEGEQIKVETAVSFNIRCIRSISVDVPTDGYNTSYKCEVSKREIPVSDYVKTGEKTVECSVDLGNIDGDIVKVNYLCMNPHVRETERSENGVKVNCMLSGFVVAVDDKGTAMGIDKKGEFFFEIETENFDDEKYDISVKLISLGYTVDENGNLTAQIELGAKYSVSTVKRYHVLESITVDTDSPKCRKNCSGIIVYFANSGESIFDIGKKYNVTVESLYSENGLTSDILVGKKKIMIPVF